MDGDGYLDIVTAGSGAPNVLNLESAEVAPGSTDPTPNQGVLE